MVTLIGPLLSLVNRLKELFGGEPLPELPPLHSHGGCQQRCQQVEEESDPGDVDSEPEDESEPDESEFETSFRFQQEGDSMAVYYVEDFFISEVTRVISEEESREEDENGDGRPDLLRFNLEMPLLDTENVVGVRLVLFFYYKLLKYSSFHMESLAIITQVAPSPAAQLYVSGDLTVRQKQALDHKGIDTRYNGSLIDGTSSFAEEYNLQTLIEKYNKRNVTTRLVSPDVVWTLGRAADSPFVIKADIAYPVDETYRYTPGFWFMIKWGWIQYVSIILIFLYIVERVKVFFFMNQLVTTIVERASDTKNKLM